MALLTVVRQTWRLCKGSSLSRETGNFRPLSRETGIARPLSRETGIDTTLPKNHTDLSLQSETAVRPEVELPAEPRKRRRRCRMSVFDNIEIVPESACTSLRHDVNPDVTPVNPSVAQEIVDSSPDEEPRRWRRKGRLVRVNSPPERTAKSTLTEEVVHVLVHRDADS
ncbi:hypothetical protein JTB14_028674 [Gonioctena quinquepunctata]|nr:hypothetical protein JTB14_028674 [Gonioctena quinquepunctata]